MFERTAGYPTAVASSDDVGVAAAIEWCLQHLENGETLTVWTSLKSNLSNNDVLSSLVSRYSNVEHITGRGTTSVRSRGPVLMAWADMDDIGKLVRFGSSKITAMCVISWNEEALRPWVATMKPDVLGDGSAWEGLVDPADSLDPVVVEGLKMMTGFINHNNTIKAGHEKEAVIGVLVPLVKAGYVLDAEAIQGWALANGWSGDNPKHLADYVRAINAGKRPRGGSGMYRPDLIQRLHEQVAKGDAN